MSKHTDDNCQVPFCDKCLERIKAVKGKADSIKRAGLDTPDLEEQKLRDTVAHIACLFFGFMPLDYWKEAVLSQHPKAADKAVALLHQHHNALLRELEGKLDKYTAKHDQYWVDEVKQILADARVGES